MFRRESEISTKTGCPTKAGEKMKVCGNLIFRAEHFDVTFVLRQFLDFNFFIHLSAKLILNLGPNFSQFVIKF